MNDLQIFNNEKYGEIRTAIINNEPYFMLADVCRVLEIKNSWDAKNRLNKHGVDTTEVIDNLGRTQQATFINESNLYKLAFTSRKKEAEEFTEWVTSEVLPSIRQHGLYLTDNKAQELITDPTAFLAKAVLVAQEQLAKISAENKVMKPKAEYFDALVERETLTNFRDTAKELGIKQNKFINWLLDNDYVYRDNKNQLKPHAGYEDYFAIKDTKSGKNKWSGTQTLITPQGKTTFRLLLEAEGCI